MKKSTYILAAALVAGLAACNKQAQAVYDKQETNISSFVERTGLLADTLQRGGPVSFHYAGYTLSGNRISASNLFATNHQKTADAAGWKLTDTTAFKIETLTLDDSLVEGLALGLEGVRNQDECYILFSGKRGYGSRVQGTIPAMSALVYHVWISSISND